MKRLVPLEKEATALCNAAAKPPLIYQLPPKQGRKILDEMQDSPVYKYPADITTVPFITNDWGQIDVHCIKPKGVTTNLNIILYIHGAGWVFGNLHTHDKLVRELAHRTNSIVVFPEYSLSPEAKYPTAIEQCYETLSCIPQILQQIKWHGDMKYLTVAGDSVGGNMATVMTMLSKYRQGPKIHKQLLYYPVTNAYFNTESYNLFATDYYLYRDGMIWFWDQYTNSDKERDQVSACPLLASLEQLKDLPDAMIINGQADVLRSEGEAYAEKLRSAGVNVTAVRFQAIIHDFVMLNALDKTEACRSAMETSISWINRKNKQKK